MPSRKRKRAGYVEGDGGIKRSKNDIAKKMDNKSHYQPPSKKTLSYIIKLFKRDKIDVLGDISSVMGNDVIADTLLSYLTISQLIDLRLVCKLWNEKISENLAKFSTKLKMLDFTQDSVKFHDFKETMENAQNKKIFSQFYAKLEDYLNLGQEFFDNHKPKIINVQLYPSRSRSNKPFDKKKPSKFQEIFTVLKWASENLKEIHISDFYGVKNFKSPGQKDNDLDKFDFKLPQLENISLDFGSCNYHDYANSGIFQIFEEIVKRAPKFNSLVLYEPSPTDPSRFFDDLKKKREILIKLEELCIYYKYSEDIDEYSNDDDGETRTGPQDLVEMGENGLENLKILNIKLNFYKYDGRLLGQDFSLISQFLESKCGALKSLGIDIGVDLDTPTHNRYKIKIPQLPNLEKLYLGNVDEEEAEYDNKYMPYQFMNLTYKFPQLREIELNLKFEGNFDFHTVFTGSCETVQILKLAVYETNHVYGPDYLPLENLFPNVRRLELNDIFQFIDEEGKNPWENSVKTICVSMSNSTFDEMLGFEVFLPFKALERIELKNSRKKRKKNPCTYRTFDMDTFETLTIKSLKIHNFLLGEEILEQISGMCILDYTPEISEFLPTPDDDGEIDDEEVEEEEDADFSCTEDED